MATTSQITAEQLYSLARENRCELIAGELRMMPSAGWRHGRVVHRLEVILGRHIEENKLGEAFGAETGFLISRDPDTVRAPDIAFIAHNNLPAKEPTEAYWPGAPDLAVEVLSPNDKTGEIDEKIQAWLAAGAKMVWVVDPQLKTVTVHRSATDISVKTTADLLEGDNIVDGFSCRIAEIFAAIG